MPNYPKIQEYVICLIPIASFLSESGASTPVNENSLSIVTMGMKKKMISVTKWVISTY